MSAERQRQYRARKGARVGQGRGPAPSAPCGTVAAYKRHQRATERPCEACRQAWAAWQRDYYQRRKASPAVAGGRRLGGRPSGAPAPQST